MMNKRFIWKQAENKNEILLENRNSMISGHKTGTLRPECITNTQSDTIIHNKTQTTYNIHRQEELNKEFPRSL
jgi:hypothetical protein